MEPENVSVSIVIPAQNERDNVEPLIKEIRQAMDNRHNYELIYVDDGSTDDTLAILKQVKENFPQLRILSHEKGVGQSLAVLNGVRHGVGEWLVILDADGQNDPADIPRILEELQRRHINEPDLIGLIGHRVTRRDDWVKRLSSKLANGFRDLFLRDGIPDTGCGLKALRREWYLQLPCFDHMHRYIPALVQAQGGKMQPFPVNHRPRQAGISKYGVWNRLWVGLVDVVGVWWLQRRSKKINIREFLD